MIHAPQVPVQPSEKESEEEPGEEHSEQCDKEEKKEAKDNDDEKSGVRKRVGIRVYRKGKNCEVLKLLTCLSGEDSENSKWGTGHLLVALSIFVGIC